MPEPGQKFGALFGSDASSLMRQVRSNIAVGQKRLAGGERGFELGFGFEAISGVKQGREARVHSFERAEVAIEIAGDEASERGFVAREADAQVREAVSVERFAEQLELRGFAAAINAFDGDEFSARWHECVPQSTMTVTCDWSRQKSGLAWIARECERAGASPPTPCFL